MNEANSAKSAAEQEIMEAEREWAGAVMRRDSIAADRILADEFRLTGPDLERLSTGRAATKDIWMAALGSIETRSFDITHARIEVYGRGAVAFLRATLDWSIQSRQLPSQYMLTDLWVQRDGRWQVLTRLSEPLD